MKKILYFITAALATLFLVACNTTEEGTVTKEAEKQTNGSSVVDKAGVDTEEKVDEPITKNPNNETEKEYTVSTEENKLVYVSKGKEVEVAISTVESDNQNFKLSLLPNFSLSAEEPGKDVVFYDGDENVFMRIETVASADSNYDDMLQATKDFMNAGSSNGETTSYSEALTFAPTNAKNKDAFINDYADDRVVALLFETEELFVRLTVFDTKTADLTEGMLKMASTITVK